MRSHQLLDLRGIAGTTIPQRIGRASADIATPFAAKAGLDTAGAELL